MSNFKDHKISLNQVLSFIPKALLNHLSAITKVDYYNKVLHGKKCFICFYFAFLTNKLNQRTLEDTFNSSGFKALFGLDEDEKVRRSSISERLSKIDSNYFKKFISRCMTDFLNFMTSLKSKNTILYVLIAQ